jgi:3-deoxy-D-manno-octulosonic-acid transferase
MIGHLILAVRRLLKKEHPTRWPERLARPTAPRPDGKIIWIHAASVGEVQTSLTLLPFLDTLRQATPLTLLITTGTVASAAFIAPRLPDWALHQFYPLDTPILTRRFLNYWRPCAALWMESEIWPFMLRGMQKRDVPILLINARLSPRSARRWGLIPRLARALMRPFTLILAQNEAAATAYRRFVDCPLLIPGNLKMSAPPLPVDPTAVAILRQAIQGRPVIVYASTHAGEEVLAATLHRALRAVRPNLLTIIAPRHPARADSIIGSLPDDLPITRRTAAHIPPTPDTALYLADTIGELGLFYQLAGP